MPPNKTPKKSASKKAPKVSPAGRQTVRKKKRATGDENKPVEIPAETRFEDAMQELESIVESLEGGDQALEESLAHFERGIGLARFCQKSLADAEQKVLLLSGEIEKIDDEDENDGLEPFDADGDNA